MTNIQLNLPSLSLFLAPIDTQNSLAYINIQWHLDDFQSARQTAKLSIIIIDRIEDEATENICRASVMKLITMSAFSANYCCRLWESRIELLENELRPSS
jgi:hypothetical protein